jgi:catechol 2,3-dioxygenase-like lactoylglutathione lyase family enzyme
MDWKIELIMIPVSDVDRAKAFYTEKIGFIADHDHHVSDEIRFVQLTPPGSACSIAIGRGLTEAPPGSSPGLQVVVEDVDAARDQLLERGVEASEIQEFPWGSFVFFTDPDGNRWSLQGLPPEAAAKRRSDVAEKTTELVNELKEKSQEFLGKHDDRIEAAIDKAASFINDKTKGKYSDRIGTVAGRAKGTVDQLAGRAEPEPAPEPGDPDGPTTT